jgi:hypothetical protein
VDERGGQLNALLVAQRELLHEVAAALAEAGRSSQRFVLVSAARPSRPWSSPR